MFRTTPSAISSQVSNLFRTIKALWVNAALPPRTLREFVDYAAARPGRLNYATGGVGSSNHVDAAWFVQAAGLDLVHVPYNGPAAGIAAVAGGDAQMMVVSITTGLPLAQSGRPCRPLAVFGDRRAALLPGVPTADEQGAAARVDLLAARAHMQRTRLASSSCRGRRRTSIVPRGCRRRRSRSILRRAREPVDWADRPGHRGDRRRIPRRVRPADGARPGCAGRRLRAGACAHRAALGTHGKPDLRPHRPETAGPAAPDLHAFGRCWSR